MPRLTAPTRSSRRSLRRSRGSASSSAHEGQGRRSGSRRQAIVLRGRRILRRQRDLGAGRPRSPRCKSRRSGCGIRCGQLRLQTAAGTNREGTYWRYEMKLREAESRLGSITGGNGSIYAVNRVDYVEVDPRWGHDLSFPYRMVQAGRRAVYEPHAHAFEKPTPSNETEYRRKVRMFEHCWEITLRGSMFRRCRPATSSRSSRTGCSGTPAGSCISRCSV